MLAAKDGYKAEWIERSGTGNIPEAQLRWKTRCAMIW